MRELFKYQLANNKPLTKYDIDKLNNKTYFNNEKIKEGDVILFGLNTSIHAEDLNEENPTELDLNLIILNEKHFEYFLPYERGGFGNIPMIKYKQDTINRNILRNKNFDIK